MKVSKIIQKSEKIFLDFDEEGKLIRMGGICKAKDLKPKSQDWIRQK